ncbi:unnamed protein product [Lactuca virosa]|uniref:Uncharacterized protein n=1 Tax=Lactuca virosa TaxID=75947 RepID=A0AAU9LLK7_9ASTR|nr:unnamed protein product [Lactuca virosa]
MEVMKTQKKKKQNYLNNDNALGPTKKIVVSTLDKVGDETPLTKKKVNESRVLRTISVNSPPRLLYVMRCDCMVQWTAAILSLDYDNILDKSFGVITKLEKIPHSRFWKTYNQSVRVEPHNQAQARINYLQSLKMHGCKVFLIIIMVNMFYSYCGGTNSQEKTTTSLHGCSILHPTNKRKNWTLIWKECIWWKVIDPQFTSTIIWIMKI